jgi:hypothetical protein
MAKQKEVSMYKGIDLSDAALCQVSEETAKEYIDFRSKIKKPLTQGAFKRAMMAAMRCIDHGISPDEAITITIDKGWQGVVVEYVAKELANRTRASTELVEIQNPVQATLNKLTDRSWSH